MLPRVPGQEATRHLVALLFVAYIRPGCMFQTVLLAFPNFVSLSSGLDRDRGRGSRSTLKFPLTLVRESPIGAIMRGLESRGKENARNHHSIARFLGSIRNPSPSRCGSVQ